MCALHLSMEMWRHLRAWDSLGLIDKCATEWLVEEHSWKEIEQAYRLVVYRDRLNAVLSWQPGHCVSCK